MTKSVQMCPKTSSEVLKRQKKIVTDPEAAGNVCRSQNKRKKSSHSCLEEECRVSNHCGISNNVADNTVPKFIMEFYNHARNLCRSDPCGAFEKVLSARLVGPFDFLGENSMKLIDERNILHYRHATDLPEMQTVLLCDIGRYCLWRDIPNGDEFLILYVSKDSRFPQMELVGNNMEHAILHLCQRAKISTEKFLPKNVSVVSLKQQVKTVCAQRNKKKLGKTPNGVGLWVDVVNHIGYRPVPEDAGKIKCKLELICDANDSNRDKAMEWLMDMVAYVQMANDECDFGMGLELGYWLFLANHESLDKLAYRILSTAYVLLGREKYKKILDAQMAVGVRRRSELDERKK